MISDILPPDYVSGLVDGEGCFVLGFRRDKKYQRKGQPEYFYWKVSFAIALRRDDKALLEKVKNTLGCGRVCVSKDTVQYRVNKIDDLKHKILSFFLENPLFGKKREDFILWAEALDILYQNYLKWKITIRNHKGQRGFPKMKLEAADTQRLLLIKQQMENYKSKRPTWKWLSTLDEVKYEY